MYRAVRISPFYVKCAKAKLSKRDTEIAYRYFVLHHRAKEIWLWLCTQKEYEPIEWDSVYQLLWRIRTKLKAVEDL